MNSLNIQEPTELPKKGQNVTDTFYVTTPIYYVNASPHLGHAYTTILADVLTRYHRALGHDSKFQTGTDEHGEKIAIAASKEGISSQEFVDKVSATFSNLWKKLRIEPDNFVRTSDKEHKKVVQEVLNKVHDSGDIYFDHYDGYYCVGCERYMTEKELHDGKCPDHDTEVEKRSESNWFFKMEKYRPWLRQFILDNPDFIQPEGFRNETLAMLENPIGDLSISRPKERVPWGIEIPWDTNHVTYVWFDALLNYISGIGYPDGSEFSRYWKESVHLIAKDILKPHCVFWPCMLKAAGIDPYKAIKVHGYWLTDEGKMSKSRGNVVKPLDLVGKYGNDAFRYFLMRGITFGRDATFSEEGLAKRINSDLANDLGNLLHRTTGMIGRYHDGVILGEGEITEAEKEMKDKSLALGETVSTLFNEIKISDGIEAVLELVRATNRYIDHSEPWKLVKSEESAERLKSVMYTCCEVLRISSILLDPVMPWKMAELRKHLGIQSTGTTYSDALVWGAIPGGTKLQTGEPLFPRIDLKALEAQFGSEKKNEKEQNAPAKQKKKEKKKPAPLETPDEISFEDFWKVKLVVVKIKTCEKVEGADKLLMITLDNGEEGGATVLAGLAPYYAPEELVGKRALWVANLAPRKMRGHMSQGMLLASDIDGTGVKVIEPPEGAKPGTRVS